MLCALFVQFQRRYFLCTCVQKKNMLFCVQGGQIICLKVKLAFLSYKQIAQLWQSSPKIAKCAVETHSCTMHTEHQQYQGVELGNLATVQTCAMCHLVAFYMVRLHPSGIWAPSQRLGCTDVLNNLETCYLVNLSWNLFLSYCSCLY